MLYFSSYQFQAERDVSNEYADYQPGSLITTDRLIKDLDNFDIVFHIGDMPYANGYISQWDQFTSQVEPIASVVPYMVASGNHERDTTGTGSFYDTNDSGGECGVPAETMYYVPAENRAKFWYATDYGMFHFCIADTEHDWREGSEQYKFIEKCFASANRHKQPWLIFAVHCVLGYSSDTWYVDEGSFEEPMGRDDMQKRWQRYNVDIAFYGHVHNYERICPIYQNQCVNSEIFNYSGTVNGTIHVVVGGGGSQLSDFSTLKTVWSIYQDLDFGYTKLTAYNHSSLLFEYMKSRGYTKTGIATLKFQLINQRADFSFALFSGGLSNPKLVAVSNILTFANSKAPVYPRLAQGKSWNEMTVTWTSGYSIGEAVPFVEWGMQGDTQKRSAAATLTFDQSSLCGSPARTVGWRDPGFIHTSFLKNLWPNTVYTYRMGHRLSDGRYIRSKVYSFRSSPYPGQDSLQRVVIFGDMGKAERDGSNEYSDYQPGALNITDQHRWNPLHLLCHIWLAAVITNVIGLIRGPITMEWIQVENVACNGGANVTPVGARAQSAD
ncbi:hypothetical protein ACLB2K_044039 [Fragaria x ananassa]